MHIMGHNERGVKGGSCVWRCRGMAAMRGGWNQSLISCGREG